MATLGTMDRSLSLILPLKKARDFLLIQRSQMRFESWKRKDGFISSNEEAYMPDRIDMSLQGSMTLAFSNPEASRGLIPRPDAIAHRPRTSVAPGMAIYRISPTNGARHTYISLQLVKQQIVPSRRICISELSGVLHEMERQAPLGGADLDGATNKMGYSG